MKTRYLKLSTAVLVTLMGVCGLSACKNDKTSLPWDSEDIDGMMVPEYGCPFWEETDSAYTSQHEKVSALKAVIQELEQEAQEQ